MRERPRIGVTLATVGVDAAWWLDSARRLDEAGYAAIWAWDHFVGKGDRRVPVLEATALLAAAAAVTTRVTVGSFVMNVMNREPSVLARTAGTIHELSGGRFALGIGIGGHRREHTAYGIPFPEPPERAARLEEAISVIRALWTGGPATIDARFYSLHDAYAEPHREPPPPILVGAQSRTGVGIAARAGDGWAAEMPFFEELLSFYRESVDAAGRDVSAQRIVLGFNAGRSGEEALRDSPWVEAPGETWAEWHDRGADEVTVTARTPADIARLLHAAERW